MRKSKGRGVFGSKEGGGRKKGGKAPLQNEVAMVKGIKKYVLKRGNWKREGGADSAL